MDFVGQLLERRFFPSKNRSAVPGLLSRETRRYAWPSYTT